MFNFYISELSVILETSDMMNNLLLNRVLNALI